MKITPKNSIKKHQMGGEMTPVEDPNVQPAPTEEVQEPAQQDPAVQIAQMAMQALQTQNCEMAMQVCQLLLEIAQGGAPQESMGEHVFAKNGAKLVRRIKK